MAQNTFFRLISKCFHPFAELKGTVTPDYNCMKVVLFKRAWYGNETLDIKKMLSEPKIFNRQLKFLCLGSKSIKIFNIGFEPKLRLL